MMAASVAASAGNCNRAALDAVAASVAAGVPPKSGLQQSSPHAQAQAQAQMHAQAQVQAQVQANASAQIQAQINAVAAANATGGGGGGAGLMAAAGAGLPELSWSHAADLVNAVLSTARQRYSMSVCRPQTGLPIGTGLPTSQIVANSVAAVAAAQQQPCPNQLTHLSNYRHLVASAVGAPGVPSAVAAAPAAAAPACTPQESTIPHGVFAGPSAQMLTHRSARRPDDEATQQSLARPNQLLEQQHQIRRILQQAAQQAQLAQAQAVQAQATHAQQEQAQAAQTAQTQAAQQVQHAQAPVQPQPQLQSAQPLPTRSQNADGHP